MKRCIVVSLISLLFALLLPALLWLSRAGAEDDPDEAVDFPAEGPEEILPELRSDSDVMLTFLREGRVSSLSMEEYLLGAVAGEMPASFEPAALEAQAAAARTYVLRRAEEGSAAHPEADVCDDPACCMAWLSGEEREALWGGNAAFYEDKLRRAVAATDGAVLVYEGEPILACFHASSDGKTESSAAVWGRALPYLVSVDSPESADSVPNFVTTALFSPAEFKEALAGRFPETKLAGDPASWLGETVRDASGRTAAVRIGGVAVPGDALRALFSLRSTDLTLEWTQEGFLFTVTGSGHGVGMSQYGANVMAESGAGWQEILEHYYPGANLIRILN